MEVQKCVVWWVDENSLRVPTGLVNKFIIVINQLASGIWHTDATLYENRMNQTQRLGKEESKAATKKWTNYIWLFHWISLATFCHWLHQISLRLRKRHSPKLAHQNWQWLSHWNDSWISMDVRLIFLNCHPLNWIEIGLKKKVEIRQKKLAALARNRFGMSMSFDLVKICPRTWNWPISVEISIWVKIG